MDAIPAMGHAKVATRHQVQLAHHAISATAVTDVTDVMDAMRATDAMTTILAIHAMVVARLVCSITEATTNLVAHVTLITALATLASHLASPGTVVTVMDVLAQPATLGTAVHATLAKYVMAMLDVSLATALATMARQAAAQYVTLHLMTLRLAELV